MQSLQWQETEGRRKMLRTRNRKYMHDPNEGEEELYNLAYNP